MFDFAASFSSIEHSGLGRYGDPLDPAGDFKAMAQVSCMVKPGGFFFFTVPFGFDCIEFNSHRIYGPVRLPYMLENWRVVDYVGTANFQFRDDPTKKCTPKSGGFSLQNARGCINGW
eukprot:TRINITY_DN3492_c0_g1_i2.p1 TRINITY_DN3492_c0_g1~~TRINITY_DN3492_c0_g1_i2.p1  ORF type:complete len:117 (+),score=15.81 TRINITY_DN3492_c0_g1_i2:118-468(+)